MMLYDRLDAGAIDVWVGHKDVSKVRKDKRTYYANDNSKYNNHPNAFTFKNIAQQLFKVGYSLYGSNDHVPK